MSILSDVLNRFGWAKAALDTVPEVMKATASYEGTSHIDPGKWENQARLYRQLSWVHTAVSMIARSAAVVPFSVSELVNEETTGIVNHEFEILLNYPNPLMSRYELLEATASFRALTGNAYWWLNRPSPDAPPVEIWLLPSYMVQPVPDEQMYLKGYLFEPGGGDSVFLQTWEITHFKTFNPLSTFVGLSPIEALATIAVGDLKMQEWNRSLFADNNARLPGILAFADPIKDPVWEVVKKDTEESAKTRQIMMMRNIGKGGVQWLQNSVSHRDMEFLAGREFTKEEIFSVYAPGLSSMLAVNATEANSKTGQTTFSEYGVWPLLVAMAEKITTDILPTYGENQVGAFADIRTRDRVLEMAEQEVYSQTHTIDEVRGKYYHDEPIGDERGALLQAEVATVADDGPEPNPTGDNLGPPATRSAPRKPTSPKASPPIPRRRLTPN